MTPEELIEAVRTLISERDAALARVAELEGEQGWALSDTAASFAARVAIKRIADEISGEIVSDERAQEISLQLLRFADICTYCEGSGSSGDEAAFPEPAREYACPRCHGDGLYNTPPNVRDAGPTPYSGRTTRREG